MSYYDYQELTAAAMADNAPQGAIDALGEWFDRHGTMYWNGECYTVDDKNNISLYPVYRELGEDEFELVGYTFSADPADRQA